MLILSRRCGEVICISGQLIKIMVVEIRHDSVRIGIEAPPEISVNREEIEEQKRNSRP